MRKKHILGIGLALVMLIMTACGGNDGATPGSAQGYEPEMQAQAVKTEAPGEDASESSQEDESGAREQASESDVLGEDARGEDMPREDTPEISQSHASQEQGQTSESTDTREDTTNDNLPAYGNYYYDVKNVVLYLEVYDELPPNYITKDEARDLGWEGGSVENYQAGAAIGGDYFGNREGLLPEAAGRSYTECDIDTNGYSSRGSRRLVFSNDGLYFYTSDHYETFSEVTVTDEYEVIW